MSSTASTHAPQQAATAKPDAVRLQRKCACGTHTIGGAECDGCRGEGLKLRRAAVNRIPLRPNSVPALQPKLTVNAPGDVYEQEADRVAERVAGRTETRPRSACGCEGGGCARCGGETGARERVQTKRMGPGDAGKSDAPHVVHEVLSSHGRPLDPGARSFMESRFGHDFSRVRVHTDAKASESAAAVNARAYTVGNDIVFGHGRFDLGGAEGRRLLAHELTHVLQQSAGDAPAALAREPDEGTPAAKADAAPANAAPAKPLKCDIGCAQRWGRNTSCSRWGFQLGAHEREPRFVTRDGVKNPKKVMDMFRPCCNSWPWSVEQYAIKVGLDGAASCTARHGRETATVQLLDAKGKEQGETVTVLCSDTIPVGGAGAHFGTKPPGRTACTDAGFVADNKIEVIEMSPNAMRKLAGGVNNRLLVKVCYSGSQEDLCTNAGPSNKAHPQVTHCITPGCDPDPDTPKLENTGWPP